MSKQITSGRLEAAKYAVARVAAAIPALPKEWTPRDVDRRIRAADEAWTKLKMIGAELHSGTTDRMTFAGIVAESSRGRGACIDLWLARVARELDARRRAAA